MERPVPAALGGQPRKPLHASRERAQGGCGGCRGREADGRGAHQDGAVAFLFPGTQLGSHGRARPTPLPPAGSPSAPAPGPVVPHPHQLRFPGPGGLSPASRLCLCPSGLPWRPCRWRPAHSLAGHTESLSRPTRGLRGTCRTRGAGCRTRGAACSPARRSPAGGAARSGSPGVSRLGPAPPTVTSRGPHNPAEPLESPSRAVGTVGGSPQRGKGSAGL